MSVAGIASSCFSYGLQDLVGKKQQFQQEFQQLGKDLQSGDLSAAQSDFASLQSLKPGGSTSPSSTTSTQTSSPISQDFQQLSKDLQSGDTAAAQQDFAKIQQDFQSMAGSRVHGHHHHHRSDASGSEISKLMDELTQSLKSGDLTNAQQTYSTLMQDFQQFGQSNGLLGSTSQSGTNSVSVTA